MKNAPTALLSLSASLVLSLSQASPNAVGAVVLSNLDGNDAPGTSLDMSTRSKAMGFDVGGADLGLDSVVLRLNIDDFTRTTMDVKLFDTDGFDNPGTELFTFSNPTIAANGIANFTFDAPANTVLQAGGRYWIVARDLGDFTRSRWMASDPPQTPVDPDLSSVDATHAGTRFSADIFPPTETSSILNSYALVTVPEPGWFVAVSGFALGTTILCRASRQRRPEGSTRP